MSGPRDDQNGERQADAASKASEALPFRKVIAELTEPKASLVVAKMRAGDHAKPDIRITGRIGVAMLQAQIDQSACDEGREVCICKKRRRRDLT